MIKISRTVILTGFILGLTVQAKSEWLLTQTFANGIGGIAQSTKEFVSVYKRTSLGYTYTIDTYSTQSKELISSVPALENEKIGYFFSPIQPEHVISVEPNSGQLNVVDVTKNRIVNSIETGAGAIVDALFSEDGNKIVAVHENQDITIWNGRTAKLLLHIENRKKKGDDRVALAKLLKNDELLLFVVRTVPNQRFTVIEKWNGKTGQKLFRHELTSPYILANLKVYDSLSADGKYLVVNWFEPFSANEPSYVVRTWSLLNVDSGEIIEKYGRDVYSLEFIKGTSLLSLLKKSSSYAHDLRIFDPITNKTVYSKANLGGYGYIEFSKGGNFMLSSGKITNIKTGKEVVVEVFNASTLQSGDFFVSDDLRTIFFRKAILPFTTEMWTFEE